MKACSIFQSSGLNPFVDENNHTVAGSWTIVIVLPSHQWQASCSSTWTCTHMPTHVAVCSMVIDFHPRCRRHGVQTLGVEWSRHSHRRPWQVWNVAFAKFCELNGPHFDFQGCEFPPNAEKDSTDSALHDATKVPAKGVFRNGPNISKYYIPYNPYSYKMLQEWPTPVAIQNSNLAVNEGSGSGQWLAMAGDGELWARLCGSPLPPQQRGKNGALCHQILKDSSIIFHRYIRSSSQYYVMMCNYNTIYIINFRLV